MVKKIIVKYLGVRKEVELKVGNGTLKYVRIYFGAWTFNRVTKDRAVKFIDEISAIGGTLGLFTGFAIMSAVEIVYFGVKIILQITKEISTMKTNVMTVK